MSRNSVSIDILAGSRIVQDGRRWVADICIGSGQWRATCRASASNPSTAAHRAIAGAWDSIRREQTRVEDLSVEKGRG